MGTAKEREVGMKVSRRRGSDSSSEEKPIELNDDACDALRYAIASLDPAMTQNPWAQLAGKRVGAVA